MADKTTPNPASDKSKAEGDRDENPGGRYDQTMGDEGSGITNRPLSEELENQESLPERGKSREGANAGRGHRDDERTRGPR
jgi:hypothetical protein